MMTNPWSGAKQSFLEHHADETLETNLKKTRKQIVIKNCTDVRTRILVISYSWDTEKYDDVGNYMPVLEQTRMVGKGSESSMNILRKPCHPSALGLVDQIGHS